VNNNSCNSLSYNPNKEQVKRLLIFVFVCLHITAFSQYWQQDVNYTINVTLNDKDKTLDAFEKIVYTNNSPDTLKFIWFHLWMNAYKNDKTAFSEQMVANNNTDFYFSKEEEKGYINRLDFKVNDVTATITEHPVNIDIARLNLPTPLPPGKSITITTPFHVKLPKNFSRGGYTGETFQITQWYPKPAVYDSKGWHRLAYLDQGEFYSEFGKFDVTITVPSNYIVASTGVLQNSDELQQLKTLGKQKLEDQSSYKTFDKELKPKAKKEGKTFFEVMPASSTETKTLRYIQDKVHDFAWFASKLFLVQYDTVRLATKTVDAFTFFYPWQKDNWEKSISFEKEGLRKYSEWVSEYPYSVMSAVSGDENKTSGGMEYPTITLITTTEGGQELDITIVHEVGHNWFYGVLATNERDHAWMDEGFNSYYQNRYELEKYGTYSELNANGLNLFKNKTPDDALELMLNFMFKIYKDQPIETTSEQFSFLNYGLIVYLKAGIWMKKLEEYLGKEKFDQAMKAYYNEWKFKHPQPEDFKTSIEKSSGGSIEELWKQLFTTGPLTKPEKKNLKLTGFYNLRNTDKYNYISLAPGIGYNRYDGLMLGAMIHNYQLPFPNFRFAIVPLVGITSASFKGIGTVSYHLYKKGKISEIAFGLNGARFSINDGVDSNKNKVFSNFYKFVPSVRIYLNNKSTLSTKKQWFDLRSFLITEQGFNYVYDHTDSNYFPEKGAKQSRYINQLTFATEDDRKLYPYRYEIQIQQGKEFYRASATLNYFFNYQNKGGLKMRVTAIKFGYIDGKTPLKEANTYVYQPKLTAVRGNEDYTYSNAFIGRNEFEGLSSQQIIERDGNLKLRTDLFQNLQGRSDDWIASINLSTTIPRKLLPFPIELPIKIFADAGTYADAWKKNTAVTRFLYVAGLEISIFKDFINIYAPLVYSKEFGNSLKTVPEENKFTRRISFSINVQNLSLKKFICQLP
jgi:hypothetical protein